MFKFFSRNRAKKYHDIEYIINKEQLIEMYNNVSDLDSKLRIISNLLNLGFIDIAKEYLNQVLSQFSDSVYQNIRWYKIHLAIAIEEEDDFSIKTIIKRLVDNFKKPKYYYDYLISRDLKKQMEIYRKEIFPIIHKIIKTDLRDFCLITYIWSNFHNQEHIALPKIEKEFFSRINDLKTKPKHNISDIIFVQNLSNAIIAYCNQNYQSVNQINYLKEVLDVNINIIDLYFSNFSEKKRSIFEDIFVFSNHLLYEITSDLKYVEKIKQFTLKYKDLLSTLYTYTAQKYELDKSISFIDTLKKLCNEKKKNHIIELFLLEMSNNNIEELLKAKDVIKSIEDDEIKEIVLSMLSYVEFINGSKINKEEIDRLIKVIRLPLIILYAMNYENGLLNDIELDNKIRELSPIPTSFKLFIRLFSAFYKNNNSERLLLLCEKIDIKRSETAKIFQHLLLKIYNEEIIINYFEFERLVTPILNININIDNLIVIVAINYKAFLPKYMDLVRNNIQIFNSGSISWNEEIMASIVYNYLLFCIEFSKQYELPDIKESLKHFIDKRNTYLKPAFYLALGQLYPDIIKENYYQILNFLNNQFTKDISDWTNELEFAIYKLLFIEQLENPTTIEFSEDEIYIKEDGTLYAGYNKKLDEYYKTLNISTIQNLQPNGYNKLSLLNAFISRTVYNNPQYFGLTSVSIPEKASAIEILSELGKHIGWDITQKSIDEFNRGIAKMFVFNVFTEHSLFKNIQEMFDGNLNSKLFNNIDNNKVFLGLPKIVHPCSLILLAVIDALVIVEKNKTCYVFESIFYDITSKYSFQINDLADGILDKRVYFEDSLERLSKLLSILKEENRVIILPIGGIFSNKIEEKLHKYDIDAMKVILQNKDNPMVIITDDMFYYQIEGLTNIITGSFSLVAEAYYYGYIDDKELLRITKELNKINYSNLFSPNIISLIYGKLEKEGKSDAIEEVFSIIGRSNA